MTMNELRALVQAVEAQRPPLPSELLRAQRQRLLADPRARVRAARRTSGVVAGAALALSLAGAWLFVRRADPPPADRSESRARHSLEERAASERRLEDGTSIRLGAGTLGQLAQGEPHDVRFDLERGRAEFDVTHNRARTFRVVAGKYEVLVLGTRFSVDYDPAAGLAVSVARGVVTVAAPGRASTRLEAGERLAVTEGRWAIERAAGELPVGADVVTPDAIERGAGAAPRRDSVENAPHALPSVRTPRPDWRRLYLAGDYAGALRVARDLGLERLELQLDAAALADLADSARLGGDPSAALRLLGALERRFPASKSATLASFLSGRLLARQGLHAEAISAFERHLERDPDGMYASETRGRLMEAYTATGDHQRARALAKAYLARYPEGPYQRLARSLIAGP